MWATPILEHDAGGAVGAFLSDDFESYSLGEIDGQGSWSETAPSTNKFMVVSSPVNGGVRALHADKVTGNNDSIELALGTQTSDFSAEFEVRSNDAGGSTPRMILSNGDPTVSSNNGPYLRISGNDFQAFDGTAWQDVTTGNVVSNNTWYKIKIVLSLASDNFEFFLDDVKQGTTHSFRDNQTQITNFSITTAGATDGDDLFVDDMVFTSV